MKKIINESEETLETANEIMYSVAYVITENLNVNQKITWGKESINSCARNQRSNEDKHFKRKSIHNSTDKTTSLK